MPALPAPARAAIPTRPGRPARGGSDGPSSFAFPHRPPPLAAPEPPRDMTATQVETEIAALLNKARSPAAVLGPRSAGFRRRAANAAWEARVSSADGTDPAAKLITLPPLRRALMNGAEFAALTMPPIGGPALAFVAPVRGGHGDAVCWILALTPLPGESRARGAIAAAAHLRDDLSALNAGLEARRLPRVSAAALQDFSARDAVLARLRAL